jgi:uncharacterized protein YqjF (DUF2071 family)
MLDVLKEAGRQARSLQRVKQRPWPVREGRWVGAQTWEELLFAHWPVPLDEVRHRVPRELEVELHDGSAWIGIVPFRLTGLRLRGTVALPRISSFLELNVRTYVRASDGKPGVWFFSLDASSALAVRAARRLYKLPYFDARMSLERRDGWREYECVRSAERGKVFSGRYRPVGKVFQSKPGSLERFLTERYCLYTTDRGGLLRADVHHAQWPLQRAEAELGLTSIAPFELRGEPLCHFSPRQDMLLWPLERV